MFKNYLLVALRFFSRQRGFSVINISGLTIGVACSLLILLFIQDEISYDKFHPDASRISRIGFQGNIQGAPVKTTLTGFPVGEVVRGKVAEVASTCRIASWHSFPVKYDSLSFTEPYLLLADSNFFNFFSFSLIAGDPKSVLSGERKVVISESAAKKYFGYQGKGDLSPIGKKLALAQDYMVEISGIAADAPRTSHFHFTLILSLASWENHESREWLNNKVITYFKIREGSEHDSVNKKVLAAATETLSAELNYLRNTDIKKYEAQGSRLSYFVQPLLDVHLTSRLANEIEINGNRDYIYLFGSIAAFITFLACINFMNLTTARSASRAKEVAVRKAVGAQNNRLVSQFLLESYLYVLAAVTLGILLLLIALVPFNYFTGKDLTLQALFNVRFLGGIFVFIGLTGLVAGSYPAFYLTTFSPVQVLKGDLRAKLRTYGIRNILVVFQFFISTCLIIATLVMYQQLRYMERLDVGFSKENIVNLLHTRNLSGNAQEFKKELMAQKGVVISASYANRLPPNIDWQSVFRLSNQEKDFQFAVAEMDYDHAATMGYRMVDGRYFDREENDSLSVILNQTAARMLGIRDFEGVEIFTTYDQPGGRVRTLIGIMKDFHFQSVREPIYPLAIILGYEPNWEMAIRVTEVNEQVIETIRKIYTRHSGGAPFEYSIVEKNFNAAYEREARIGLLFLLFSALAIVIACLGLFGLATFTVEQQRKAIGIRKVLGASVQSIVTSLNRGFILLVLVANALAWPFAWWLMQFWLNGFAFHVTIPWWVFALAGLVTVLIALGAVSTRAISAARSNPVNSLRND